MFICVRRAAPTWCSNRHQNRFELNPAAFRSCCRTAVLFTHLSRKQLKFLAQMCRCNNFCKMCLCLQHPHQFTRVVDRGAQLMAPLG